MCEERRVVITGMSINTPLGDTLPGFLENLLDGRSAIVRWKGFDSSNTLSKVGGDLSDYDIKAKCSSLQKLLPVDLAKQMTRLVRTTSWSSALSVFLAMDAFLDASLFEQPPDLERVAAIVAGHNINEKYIQRNWDRFGSAPDSIDSMFAQSALDTDHAGCIAEVLGIQGPSYTVGAACASGNVALRNALDEIRCHGQDLALVVGAVYDISPAILHGLATMGAISFRSFNDEPSRASRAFDVAREGFVPAHGGGALVLEELGHALSRGARIYGELLGAEVSSSARRLPKPSEEHEAMVMERLLKKSGIAPGEIDFISAHATSTPLGDVAEIRAIKRVFGDHAAKLKINAAKSMLGHTCWSSAVVETVAALLQMQAGRLHPSINIDQLDPEIDLDVCANWVVDHEVRCFLKNAFGFGGINSSSIIRRYDG